MNLRKMYDSIENPLNSSTLRKLVDVYSKSSTSERGFYAKLMRDADKKDDDFDVNKNDMDEFYVRMTNIWKRNMAKMDQKFFDRLYFAGKLGGEFVEFREFILNTPEIHNRSEYISKIRVPAIQKFELSSKERSLAENYVWDKLEGGWMRINSNRVKSHQERSFIVNHRLYLGAENRDLYKVLNILVENFEKKNLPYDFKYDLMVGRDDSIVIYADSELLPKYLEMFDDIEKEHPELIAKLKSGPLLSGKIKRWLGYGSEPKERGISFNSKRAKILEKALTTATVEWVFNNPNFKHNESGLLLYEFVAKKAAEKIAFRAPKEYQKDWLLSAYLNKTLNNNIEEILECLSEGEFQGLDQGQIKYTNNTILSFTSKDFLAGLKELAPHIVQADPKFLSQLKDHIDTEAKKEGIDINKFCFDTHQTKEIMSQQSELLDSRSKTRNQGLQSKLPQKENPDDFER